MGKEKNDKASRCCWSAYQKKRLGEVGFNEMRLGEMRLGKMRLGKMLPNQDRLYPSMPILFVINLNLNYAPGCFDTLLTDVLWIDILRAICLNVIIGFDLHHQVFVDK